MNTGEEARMQHKKSKVDQLLAAVASIWFEICWVMDPGPKNFDFSKQILQKIRFFQAISKKNFNFIKQISEKFQFLGNFTLIFQAKIGHLQLLCGKLFYFSSKVTAF